MSSSSPHLSLRSEGRWGTSRDVMAWRRNTKPVWVSLGVPWPGAVENVLSRWTDCLLKHSYGQTNVTPELHDKYSEMNSFLELVIISTTSGSAFLHGTSTAPKKNTSHGNEMLLQDTTHLIQRPCYQQGIRAKIQQAIGPHEDLTIVKRRRLHRYGHVSSSSGLAKTILQGTVKGGRRQDRQRKRWEDNTREWKGLEFVNSQRTVENSGKKEETGCEIICGTPTTLTVKG